MASNVHEYHRPADSDHAAAILQRAGVRTAPLAVGPRVPDEPLAGVEAVVDLTRVGLDYINATGDGPVHIGAGTTLQQLVDSVPLQSLAGGIVAEAALLVAGSAMRHAATVGGALRYARQAAAGALRDGPPELLLSLLVLNAEVVVVRGAAGQQVVGLADFLATAGNIEADLLIEVRFARPAVAARAALARVARTPRDQAIVAAAALVDGATVRIAVAAGGGAILRVPAAEAAASGPTRGDNQLEAVATAVQAAVAPAGDFRGSAEYRRVMSGVLARRALREALGSASKELP